MSELKDVLIIAVLFLVPLFPAAVIYYLLTMRRNRERGRTDGNFDVPVLGFRMSFRAFGSTATYMVILALAVSLFLSMQANRREDQMARARHAWHVEVPVYIEGPQGRLDPADKMYTQVQAQVKPFQDVRNNLVSFWVVKGDDGRFPQVDLSIPATAGQALALDDPTSIVVDEESHQIRVSKPKVFRMSTPYDLPQTSGGTR